MTQLTKLERAAISAILAEKPNFLSPLREQLQSVVVEKRENTGGGFFTTISVSSTAAPAILSSPLGLNVYANVDGMEYGLGMLLFFEHGRMSLLEGYSVGGENTSAIKFEQVAFAIRDAPSTLLGNVS
ncbi:hypothetical protein ASE85_02220 [Sphingobium sp. Leaf26]|uniref:hypothetical protein n=1 Tax=Sphingobium sp. Leaf26 TaxID=1735693 RepID=UPI0006F2D90B|nr:hypothetical protein [Sphingobium sp. Leaf26]KQN09777.1 hypothetical protein ASE85_02220 [Sphingobium sp. Leaf26]